MLHTLMTLVAVLSIESAQPQVPTCTFAAGTRCCALKNGVQCCGFSSTPKGAISGCACAGKGKG